MKKSFLLFYFLISVQVLLSENNYQLSSPDKKLTVRIKPDTNKALVYELLFDNEPVVLESKFGITVNGQSWNSGIEIKEIRERSQDLTWKPVYGERSVIRDHFNEIALLLTREGIGNLAINLTIRLYNEGMAFRFGFGESTSKYGMGPLHITGETTEYAFPDKTMAWHTRMAQTPHNYLPLKDWPSESDRPLTLELPNGLFACLTEAALVNYARTKFRLSSERPNTLTGFMYDSVDELPPFSTPWRVIMVTAKAVDLLQNNDLILNLNKPCEIHNTSWIKPGKVMREVTLTTSGAKKLVDFCVAHHILYIDLTFWNGNDTTYNATKPIPVGKDGEPYDMPEIIRYAKSKGIGVWLYVNQRPLENQIDSLLPLYHSWGINGIKFGFVHVGSHRWTVWLHEAMKKCARFQIMADIHDEYRPTGFSRTYPNLLTQEGVRGNEEMPDAVNNTILPFTRFIAGAADYTMCYYARKEFGRSSRYILNTPAHQLALPVVFYSPLQYMFWYDTPDNFQGEPEIEFWDALATVWDDTRVLAGEIGKYISVARRSGENWFLGSITNTESRELRIPLSFLEKGKKYEATFYSDDSGVNTRTHVGIRKEIVDNHTVLTCRLQASGGEAALIKPLPVKENKTK